VFRFEVSSDDLLHSRFAVSPLFELDSLLRILAGVGRKRGPVPLVERLRPVHERLLADTDLPAIEALFSRRYGPSFVAPPPRGMGQSIDDDLRAMRATPLATARAEIAQGLGFRPCSDPAILSVLSSPDVVARFASTLERCWHELLEPEWPQLRAVCERDVVHRSGELSRAGWAAALAGLNSKVRWHDGGIELLRYPDHDPVPLGGKGMLFIPSVFVWPEVAMYFDEPWPKAIIYPARGVAAFWHAGTVVSHDALSDLIGRTRARLLLALASPASTTQLSRVCDLALGAVGDHLRVMLRAGLLNTARSGRSVIYSRTRFGDTLVARTTSRQS
jgi:DNA-binding transcriptional ArsR family regulator